MSKILLLTFMLGFSASAQERVEYSFDGEFDWRYFVNAEPDGRDMQKPSTDSQMLHIFRLGANFRSGERFTARLALNHTAEWGHSNFKSGATQDSGDSEIGRFDGSNDNENTVVVTEAYGNWLVTDAFSVRVGRQLLEIADGHVLSNNDWEPVPTGIEGAVVTYHSPVATMNVIGARLADWSLSVATENGSVSSSQPQSNLYGFVFDINSKPFFVKRLNIHALQINKDELNTGEVDRFGESIDNRESMFRYGLSFKVKASIVDFDLNFAAHTGDQEQNLDSGGIKVRRSARMIDAKLGLSFEDSLKLRWFVGYHNDTGDDVNTSEKNEGYDPFLYRRHRNAGLMDIFRWGNLSYYHTGIRFNPWDDIKVNLDYYLFSRTSVDAVVYTLPAGELMYSNPTTAAARTTLATQNDESDLGSELDLTFVKEYEGGLQLLFRYSFFTPGSYLENGDGTTLGPNETFSQYHFRAKMNF